MGFFWQRVGRAKLFFLVLLVVVLSGFSAGVWPWVCLTTWPSHPRKIKKPGLAKVFFCFRGRAVHARRLHGWMLICFSGHFAKLATRPAMDLNLGLFSSFFWYSYRFWFCCRLLAMGLSDHIAPPHPRNTKNTSFARVFLWFLGAGRGPWVSLTQGPFSRLFCLRAPPEMQKT